MLQPNRPPPLPHLHPRFLQLSPPLAEKSMPRPPPQAVLTASLPLPIPQVNLPRLTIFTSFTDIPCSTAAPASANSAKKRRRAAAVAATDDALDDEAEPPKKRGPGRPPKKAANVEPEEEDAPAPKKRGPGRPTNGTRSMIVHIRTTTDNADTAKKTKAKAKAAARANDAAADTDVDDANLASDQDNFDDAPCNYWLMKAEQEDRFETTKDGTEMYVPVAE